MKKNLIKHCSDNLTWSMVEQLLQMSQMPLKQLWFNLIMLVWIVMKSQIWTTNLMCMFMLFKIEGGYLSLSLECVVDGVGANNMIRLITKPLIT
jgi:hypothetical protein